MTTDAQKRDLLLEFLDRRAFDPVLEAMPEQYSSERDRRLLVDVQQSAAREKDRFHHECTTPVQVRDTYISDVFLETVGKVGRELEDLELPRLRELRDQFLALCGDLGIN